MSSRDPIPGWTVGNRLRARRSSAGFSLLELMIAMIAGAFLVSAVYFASSRSSKTFQEQQRIAHTQLALRSAMEQIRADAARAGFLASPNTDTDPFVCVPRPADTIQGVRLQNAPSTSTSPTLMMGLPAALLTLNPAPTFDTTPGCSNGPCMPDILEMVGSFDTPEEFHAQWVNTTASQIGLQSWTQSFRRACPTLAACQEVFPIDRWIRVANTSGYAQFVQISSAAFTCTAPNPCTSATLTYTGTLQTTNAATACGVSGLGTGSRIGVLSGVRYFVGRILGANGFLANRGTSAADSTALKTDLVRERFTLPIAGGDSLGQSIALEYAVELDVRFIVNTAANTLPPNLVIRNSQQSSVAAPETIRSMIIRVSARTRDEDDMWPFVARALGAPLSSVRLSAVTSNSARVRSLVSEIAFPNLIGPGQ